MLTTDAFKERYNEVDANYVVLFQGEDETLDEFNKRRVVDSMTRITARDAIKEEWKLWLAATHAADLTEGAQELLFETASDYSESGTWEETETNYKELYAFVKNMEVA